MAHVRSSSPSTHAEIGPADAEADLITRLRNGDEGAYRALFRERHARLIALARSFVGDTGTAEEVVQETWLAVINGIGTFEGRSRLSTWITGILLNKARARVHRDHRLISFADLVREEAAAPAMEPERFLADGHWAVPLALWDEVHPERIVAGRELWRHVTDAIETLPPVQRAVVILRDVEGQDPADVCRMLGLSEANGRVLLHRARARLRILIDALLADTSDVHASVNKKSSSDT